MVGVYMPYMRALLGLTDHHNGDTLYVRWRLVKEYMMIKKLTKHGNSMALVIDRSVLDLLNISDDTPLEVSTDGNVLIVAPVRDEERAARFREALDKTNRKYGRALKRLAE